MARYIDADELMKEIKKCKFKITGCGIMYHAGNVQSAIRFAPTADVVPKSEVENLKVLLEMKDVSYEGLKELYDTDTEALIKVREKTEVEIAREIFAEIDKFITPKNHPIAFDRLKVEFAELKKKYMREGENK